MRTDLPLHSKSPNRARHLKEISKIRVELDQLCHAITKNLRENYGKRELLKLYFLVKEGRDIYFSIRTKKNFLAIMGYEGNLPRYLVELLEKEYPPKEQNEEEL